MLTTTKTLFLPRLLSLALAVAAAGCGDDSVNPSNPDAGPSKDATAQDGGESGVESGPAETGPAETGSEAAPEEAGPDAPAD